MFDFSLTEVKLTYFFAYGHPVFPFFFGEDFVCLHTLCFLVVQFLGVLWELCGVLDGSPASFLPSV